MKKEVNRGDVDFSNIGQFLKETGKDLADKFMGLFHSDENSEKICFKNEEGKFDFPTGMKSLGNWIKNHKPLSFGILLLLLLIILFLAVRAQSPAGSSNGVSGDVEEFAVNKDAGITTLMTAYYNSIAEGDLDTLQSIAEPISELEKGYVALLAEYVESYENVSCYVKSGLEEGTYLVCVSMSMKFYGIETPAPGVETFYIRTRTDGSYYIDNVYSTFNMQTQENALDTTMSERMTAFENEEDVLALCAENNLAYEEAVSADASLERMINSTLPSAISSWMTNAVAQQESVKAEEEAQKAAEEAAAAEEAEKAAEEAAAEAAAAEEAEAEEADAEEAQEAADSDDEDDSAAQQQGYFDEGDVVRMTSTVNIRKSMDVDSERIGVAYAGEKVTVIMSYEEGWTKVSWDGETGYIRTDVLLEQ